MSGVSKAQQKAVAKYENANYDKFLVRVPKGKKEIIQEYAKTKGDSLNGFINRLIDEEMKQNE